MRMKTRLAFISTLITFVIIVYDHFCDIHSVRVKVAVVSFLSFCSLFRSVTKYKLDSSFGISELMRFEMGF